MPRRERTPPIEPSASRTDRMDSCCALCGTTFHCGAGEGFCWCADYPHVMRVPRNGSACYCPRCLAEMIALPGGGR